MSWILPLQRRKPPIRELKEYTLQSFGFKVSKRLWIFTSNSEDVRKRGMLLPMLESII